jgi:hypothetical protein
MPACPPRAMSAAAAAAKTSIRHDIDQDIDASCVPGKNASAATMSNLIQSSRQRWKKTLLAEW